MSELAMIRYSFLGPDMEAVTEVVSERLYFVTYRKKDFLKVDKECHYFNIDQQLKYSNYFNDFGPLNLGQLYRYWLILREKLICSSLEGKRLVHWTTTEFRKRANAAFLMGSFAVIYLKMSPEYIHKLLLSVKQPYVPFQDASPGLSKYRIRLLDCFNAVSKAIGFGFICFQDFDLAQYEHFEKVQNGDLSWIIPEKLIAFSGPTTNQEMGCLPESYLPFFRANNIKNIVRLNQPQYCLSKFSCFGIKVHDMQFNDGSVPSKKIVYNFLDVCENVGGPVAVHCKAGLGRTGCLIGCYLMKHYNMSSVEAIAWMRICRPGCVIGHQQAWLDRVQQYLHRSGQLYRLRVHGDIDKLPKHHVGICSVSASKKAKTQLTKSTFKILPPNVTSSDHKQNKVTSRADTVTRLSTEKKLKSKTVATVIKIGENKKKTKVTKDRSLEVWEKNSYGSLDGEAVQQGDSLKHRKWQNTLKNPIVMTLISHQNSQTVKSMGQSDVNTPLRSSKTVTQPIVLRLKTIPSQIKKNVKKVQIT